MSPKNIARLASLLAAGVMILAYINQLLWLQGISLFACLIAMGIYQGLEKE